MKKEFDSREPILSLSEITKKDERFPFVRIKDGKPKEITVEDLQKDVARIQLSPRVPETTRKVFTVCKKLYVFGYFYYPFFTVSQHYAFLTLESAMRNKYIEIFGKDYKWIERGGFRTEEYYGLRKIRKGLVGTKVIPKEEEEMYDVAGKMRNLLSHLTKMPTLLPSLAIIKRVAEMINVLY